MGTLCARPAESTSVQQRFRLYDLVSQSPLVGAQVRACAHEDPACASPILAATTDSAGEVVMDLPAGQFGFAGYLEVTGAGVYPTLLHPTPPVASSRTLRTGYLFSATSFSFYAGILGENLVAGRGHVALVANDCNSDQLAGAQFTASTADSLSKVNYTVGRVPDANATSTDSDGAGGFLNLPPGPVTVTSRRASDGLEISSYDVHVLEGHVTSLAMPPTPTH